MQEQPKITLSILHMSGTKPLTEGPKVVRIIEEISRANPRRFVCSVPIEIGPSVLIKNVGSLLMGYSRHKSYTWRQTLAAGLYRLDNLPRHTTSHLAFDWRWLAQTIRDHFRIVETRFFPFRYLPAAISSTAFFIAEPRPVRRRRAKKRKPSQKSRQPLIAADR